MTGRPSIQGGEQEGIECHSAFLTVHLIGHEIGYPARTIGSHFESWMFDITINISAILLQLNYEQVTLSQVF